MGIGERIANWLEATEPFASIIRLINDTHGEIIRRWGPLLQEIADGLAKIPLPQTRTLAYSLYTLAGVPQKGQQLTEYRLVGNFAEDPAQTLAGILTGEYVDAELVEFLNRMGQEIYVKMVEAMMGYNLPDDAPGWQAAKRFIGTVMAQSNRQLLATAFAEAASLGQLEVPIEMMKQVYWNLGLGFTTWQATSPFIQAAVLSPLQSFVNKEFRPKRFSLSEIRDLYALGEISRAQLREELATQGYRDQDIDKVIKLSYRTLSSGDVWNAYEEGHIAQEEAVRRLRALGYDPDDIPLLFKLHQKTDTTEAKKISVSTLKSSFRKGLLAEDRFRSLMSRLGYDDQEIDLQVALLKMTKQSEDKELSTSQIKAAFDSGVIGEQEAYHYLSILDYRKDESQVLIETWKRNKAPAFIRLNRSTITQAYIAGVLNRKQTISKLQEVGFLPDDAELVVKTVEAQHPELVGAGIPPAPRPLTVPELNALVSAGIITLAEYQDRLVRLGYTTEDATALRDLLEDALTVKSRPLGAGDVLAAYLHGLLNREETLARLVELGISSDDATLLIQTYEAEHPEVFNPESVSVTRVPTVGALMSALQNEIITVADFEERMSEYGFSPSDTQLYVALATLAPPEKTRELTKSEIIKAYTQGLFTRAQAQDRLTQSGYSIEDAELLLTMAKRDVADTQIAEAYIAGMISAGDAWYLLEQYGFTETELIAFFTQYPPPE